MRVEPAFDGREQHWPAQRVVTHDDVANLENTIARQTAELNQRIMEVADLYNVQQRQANALQGAREEIDRLEQLVLGLQDAATAQKADLAAAHDKIATLENDKVALREQFDKAVRESRKAAERTLAMEAVYRARETNVASALGQVEALNSELASATAERFKLVAAMQGEKKRHRSLLQEHTSILEERARRAEALAANRETQIRNLEDSRAKLAERGDVLDSLLKSERDVAELKIRRLTWELQSALDYSKKIPSW
jgi:chromosome segregation ATPase